MNRERRETLSRLLRARGYAIVETGDGAWIVPGEAEKAGRRRPPENRRKGADPGPETDGEVRHGLRVGTRPETQKKGNQAGKTSERGIDRPGRRGESRASFFRNSRQIP